MIRDWILKNVLEGPPRVYPTPAAWLTLKQWYHYVLEAVRKMEEVGEYG